MREKTFPSRLGRTMALPKCHRVPQSEEAAHFPEASPASARDANALRSQLAAIGQVPRNAASTAVGVLRIHQRNRLYFKMQ
jgi:hypothetical protein